jgi:hypothetical protein
MTICLFCVENGWKLRHNVVNLYVKTLNFFAFCFFYRNLF